MNAARIAKPAKALTEMLATRGRAARKQRKDAVTLDEVRAAPRRNDLLPEIKYEMREVGSLKAPTLLLRTVREDHVTEIACSMQNFGVVKPLLITADGTLVDGVSCWEAAKSIGLAMLPCIVIDHLSREEVRLLRIALNRLGEKGQWDINELAIEFKDLIDLGAPMELSAFAPPEIDIVLMQDEPVLDEKANAAPDKPVTKEVVSQLGDCWQLGRHRVLCADATQPESYVRLFGEAGPARAVFTDPPFNLRINGFAVGAGAIKHREFVAASGEMSGAEFDTFLAQFLAASANHVVDGAILFVCMDWRHAKDVEWAANRVNLEHINTAVWSKGSGGLGGLYRSAHEFVLVLCKGNAPSMNNIALGKHGRDRTNVWEYPGANRRGSSANAMLADHPTPKPVELVADAILDVTNRGDIVLDPFGGSGTSVIAAEKTLRTAYTLELDPGYVDLTVQRYQAFTKTDAVHEATGMTFAQVAEARAVERTLHQPVPTSLDARRGLHDMDTPSADEPIAGANMSNKVDDYQVNGARDDDLAGTGAGEGVTGAPTTSATNPSAVFVNERASM